MSLLRQLRDRHNGIFQGRPEIDPGVFKMARNQAGSYGFVLPRQVAGTLKHGFEIGSELRDPVARALFMHHLISEVHPFADGNGRLSRLFMNAELSRLGLTRVVVPTVLREDYLSAVRFLSRNDDPGPLLRVISRCQTLHNRTPFESYDDAARVLRGSNAFEKADANTRFVMPDDGHERRDEPAQEFSPEL
jgi:hypothetical protein